MNDFYDRTGKPLNLQEWGRLMEDVEYKRVAEAHIGPLWVSTVWLGSNHRFGEGTPLIFETMVFPQEGDWNEEICERYATEEEALAGHQRIVKSLQYVINEIPTLI
jgi:hypothetical protein